MRRVVVSTIGTSLLTNQIDRAAKSEEHWYTQLRDTANCTLSQTPKTVLEIIEILKARAIQKLEQSTTAQIRLTSAELNGIYGLYQEDLDQGKQDIHRLISTDTAQGIETAKIVEDFLKRKSLSNTEVYTPPSLSTASTKDFAIGMDDLLVWLRREIVPCRERYRVCFNLVGSFKSLQGYLNTIGMFYADEIIYIFEGKESSLITIPRLPIKVDDSLLEPHVVQLALMDSGSGLSASEAQKIPEALVGDCDDRKVLSTWGALIWDECKDDLLSKSLLEFPRLEYEPTFRADYKKIKEQRSEKVKLQETLAKVSGLLNEYNGDSSILKQDPGLQYDKYTNMSGSIDHFRVTQGLRVSCISSNGRLILRRYGKEPDVNKNP
ncbi:hypothetical protein [Phormidesmis priestleyi]